MKFRRSKSEQEHLRLERFYNPHLMIVRQLNPEVCLLVLPKRIKLSGNRLIDSTSNQDFKHSHARRSTEDTDSGSQGLTTSIAVAFRSTALPQYDALVAQLAIPNVTETRSIVNLFRSKNDG